jgi:hypothetical protein
MRNGPRQRHEGSITHGLRLALSDFTEASPSAHSSAARPLGV